jgi:flagellar motor switch protein FliM
METNPRFSQTITPKETVAVISFDAAIDKVSGPISICIPFIALDPDIPTVCPLLADRRAGQP